MLYVLAVVSIVIANLAGTAFAAPAATLANVIFRCTKPNTVALTFDDGPWIYNADVVKALQNAGAKGTFFFNGNNYECIYDASEVQRVKNVYSHGHQIAAHTWSHADLATLSWDKIHDEMWRIEKALWWITGAYPAFMRPPYGSYNDLVLRAAAVRGQTVAMWDFDSGDSVGASVTESKRRYDGVVARHPSTLLALNHETEAGTVYQVLPYAIQKLQGAGYKLVTLSECLGLPAYKFVEAPRTRNASWHC